MCISTLIKCVGECVGDASSTQTQSNDQNDQEKLSNKK